MSRRMSVSLTLEAVRARTKTVTRRHPDTWRTLAPGDELTLIEKGMGLPKGAKQVVVAQVQVADVRVETLRQVTAAEVVAEGLWSQAIAEGKQFRDYYDSEDLPVVWFRAFWAAAHLGGSIQSWAVGPDAPCLLGLACRRIEWTYTEPELKDPQ